MSLSSATNSTSGAQSTSANSGSGSSATSTSSTSTAAALVLDELGANSGDLLEAVRSLTPNDVRALVVQLNSTLQSGERGNACSQQLAAIYRVVRNEKQHFLCFFFFLSCSICDTILFKHRCVCNRVQCVLC